MNKFNNYSRASKARWAKISAEERSERGRHASLLRWAKVSAKDRLKHSKKMNKAKSLSTGK